jgi:hypothetical protein
MNCDGAYCIGSVCAPYLSVVRIRGELAMRAHFRATDLYAVGSFDSNHDAVMRIGGEAPGGGPILSGRHQCHVRIRLPATSDLNSAVMLKASASAEWC